MDRIDRHRRFSITNMSLYDERPALVMRAGRSMVLFPAVRYFGTSIPSGCLDYAAAGSVTVARGKAVTSNAKSSARMCSPSSA